ncbi:MAG: mechanosensitive ion channel family protein, partial [Phaeodactylibacter sp.]|nr:mechanosensitive ion channel family protein [Phaeodactylibacter sp.]
ALLLLFFFFKAVGRIVGLTGRAMDWAGLRGTLLPFVRSLVNVSLKVLLVFSIAGQVGVDVTSFVAVLAAAGFAIGMALQGSLSNFAAGVMILIFKPYKTGDLIDVEGQMGHVEQIQIFNTIITTLDNRTVIIPNSTAIGGIITNLSAKGSLRVDLTITMPYQEDFPRIRQILLDAVHNTPKVLPAPAPFVGIETFDSHNIILAVRPYANTEDYWEVYFSTNENIKKALSENGIQIAYSEGIELGPIGQ